MISSLTRNNRLLPFFIGIMMSTQLFGQDVQSDPDSSFTNTIKPVNLIFSGILLNNDSTMKSLFIPPLTETFHYNTIEGFTTDLEVSYTKYFEDRRFYNLKPNIRYGFGNKRFQAQLNATYYYNPSRFASVQVSGGRYVRQFNRNSTLDAFTNTLNTLAFNDNFLEIYQETYLNLNHKFSPGKNFLVSTSLKWNERSPLENLKKHQTNNTEFTSNIPENNELISTAFNTNQAFLWKAELRWQLGHRYTRSRGKFVSSGDSPAIMVNYSGAFQNILGSDISFQKISLQVTDDFKVGQWGTSNILFETGDFISKESLNFMDFNHFDGKRTVYGDFQLGSFQLLDYYLYSTTGFYLQGHYEHHFPTLFAKSNSTLLNKMQPIITANYLYTDTDGHYVELGLGFEKILKIWRLDFYNSFRDGAHDDSGVRFGLVF